MNNYWNSQRVGFLLWTLRIVSIVTMLAFAAAIMPSRWFAEISSALGQEFPEQVLGFYLARNLSAMYGFVGIGMFILTMDLERFGPLVGRVGWMAIAFGMFQLLLDYFSGLPWWWTIGEGLSTVLGGAGLLFIVGWCRGPVQESSKPRE